MGSLIWGKNLKGNFACTVKISRTGNCSLSLFDFVENELSCR